MANDYRIFVGAFLDGRLRNEIQTLRLAYDPKTALVTPPHVTLAGTYWRRGLALPENEAAIMGQLQTLENDLPSFNLVMGGIGVFPPISQPVIFLKIETTPALLGIRKRLLETLGQDKHQYFTPHLTLIMRLGAQEAARALPEFENSEWGKNRRVVRINLLQLMQRGPDDPAWRCIQRIRLAGPEIRAGEP